MARKKRQKKDLRTELEKQAEILYFKMLDGTKVRVLDFNLAEKPNKYTLFFIPGFITVFQSWQAVLEVLSKDFRIYYFESREKYSSIMPNRKMERQIDLYKMAYDIKEVIEQLELDGTHYLTVCSSTGGTLEIKALSEKWLKPKGAVMVGPTVEYHMRRFITISLSIIPAFIKNLILPFVRWYIGKVYVNKKEEPEQYKKYVRAVEESELRKIRKPLRQMRTNKCWDLLPKIEVECLLIGASKDKMHMTEETFRTHELIPNSSFVDLGSNKASHSKPLADAINDFIIEIEKQEKK